MKSSRSPRWSTSKQSIHGSIEHPLGSKPIYMFMYIHDV